MFIDGKWVDAHSGKSFDVTNPATGEVLGSVPAGASEDAVAAVDAAHAS
ncbi:MAG: aldehyde dehydrogenase family protein, partial [Actinomycetota bacterium]|nr:aldehyde dehydrogenase family protein [Actinomycetota bacterium]